MNYRRDEAKHARMLARKRQTRQARRDKAMAAGRCTKCWHELRSSTHAECKKHSREEKRAAAAARPSPKRIAHSLVGRTYSRWTVVAFAGDKHWLCRCSCGVEKPIYVSSLKSGRSMSCGCLSRERAAARSRTHGESNHGTITAEYRIWCGMVARCYNPNVKAFGYWGGRGITVCDRWRYSYENFLADMGRRPSDGHSIDRIDNNGNYEPGNCRWATAKEQRANQREYRYREQA